LARFSEKEIKLIKAYYNAQQEASEGGYKVKKAQLYREIYSASLMKSATATSSFNLILKRFESLPKVEQQDLKNKWKAEDIQESITKQAKELDQVTSYIKGSQDAQKKFEVGFIEGKKAGAKQIKKMLSIVDFSTEEGQMNFLEGIATLFLNDYSSLSRDSYFDKEQDKFLNNGPALTSIAKSLVDIADLTIKRYDRSVEHINKMLKIKQGLQEKYET